MAKSQKAQMSWGELGAATFGAALGGVLGMLFSPRSGEKNRQSVARTTRKVTKSVVHSAAKTVKKGEQALSRVSAAAPKRAKAKK